jgi:hypothetical protein
MQISEIYLNNWGGICTLQWMGYYGTAVEYVQSSAHTLPHKVCFFLHLNMQIRGYKPLVTPE